MSNLIQLTRTAQHDDKQTIGTLVIPNTSFWCYCLELPWKSNQQNVSCIPPAPQEVKEYEWEKVESSPAFDYEHLWIKGVPNRSWIKIHRGNYASGKNREILGCLLVGEELTDIDSDGYVDVTNSKKTLSRLLDHLDDSGTIKIISIVDDRWN